MGAFPVGPSGTAIERDRLDFLRQKLQFQWSRKFGGAVAVSTGGGQESLRENHVRALLAQGEQHSVQLGDGVSATSISALLPISLQ